MKHKVIKRLKSKVKPYKHTIGVINSYTYRDYKTHELVTHYYGTQERVR